MLLQKRAWRMYSQCVAGIDHIDPSTMVWPPSQDDWHKFHVHVHNRTGTHAYYVALTNEVGRIGAAFKVRSVPNTTPLSLNPNYLYASRRITRALARDKQSRVNQVEGITLNELRNCPRFVDPDTYMGLQMATMFVCGATLGGRRARTWVGVQLCDVKMWFRKVTIQGRTYHAPCVEVEFRDEKVMDPRGARKVGEDVSYSQQYMLRVHTSPSMWLYRMLVFRGAFLHFDPIKAESYEEGQHFEFAPGAEDWFLFCAADGDTWNDGIPLLTTQLSNSTRLLLTRMGSQPRGFSAHRRGFVTRVLMDSMFVNAGQALQTDLLPSLARAGGWAHTHGTNTLLKVYASRLFDARLDVVGMGTGVQEPPHVWEARRKEYMGELLPVPPIHEHGSLDAPLLFKLMALHAPSTVVLRAEATALAQSIIHRGQADPSITPIARYWQPHTIFTRARTQQEKSRLAHIMKRLTTAQRAFTDSAIASAANTAYTCDTTPLPLFYTTTSLVEARVAPYNIGHFTSQGTPSRHRHDIAYAEQVSLEQRSPRTPVLHCNLKHAPTDSDSDTDSN
jgi:hypothetical protein